MFLEICNVGGAQSDKNGIVPEEKVPSVLHSTRTTIPETVLW